MLHIGTNDIDRLYCLNSRFRRTEVCFYHCWTGRGNNPFIEEGVHAHFKNDRFELNLDTDLQKYDDEPDFNYIILDGHKYPLSRFGSWKHVAQEICRRL